MVDTAQVFVQQKNRVVVPFDIRKPLASQRGPFQGVCDNKVVKKWRVLFPDLVFLIDELLFGDGISLQTAIYRPQDASTSKRQG